MIVDFRPPNVYWCAAIFVLIPALFVIVAVAVVSSAMHRWEKR